MKKKELKIGMIGSHFFWGGGAELLKFLSKGLLYNTNQQVKILVFISEAKINQEFSENLFFKIKKNLSLLKSTILSYLKTYKKIFEQVIKFKSPIYIRQEYVKSSLSLDEFRDFFKNSRVEFIYYKNIENGLTEEILKQDIDIVFPTGAVFNKDFSLPWISYIFDFQHKYFPNFFSETEIEQRDKYFEKLIKESTTMIVNSKDTKNDINKFFPNNSAKIFNLPFCPYADVEWLDNMNTDVRKKYKLPKNYFIISNQFWIHKDHKTAFKALSILINKYKVEDIHLVCTGDMGDNKFPDFIYELFRESKALKIRKYLHFTGLTPKREQIEIMKKSIALIQPTLFEGGPGGFAVYNAIALGIPVIISDIAVNLEVEGNNISIFKRSDANNLAEKMNEIINSNIKRPDKETLLKQGELSLEKLNKAIFEAINYSINKNYEKI